MGGDDWVSLSLGATARPVRFHSRAWPIVASIDATLALRRWRIDVRRSSAGIAIVSGARRTRGMAPVSTGEIVALGGDLPGAIREVARRIALPQNLLPVNLPILTELPNAN
jgi:hypothetical protein